VADTVTWSEAALGAINVLALATGVGYAVLAARRNRLCWIVGAVSSVASVVLAATSKLPMLAALYVFYVGMSVYGWASWKRGSDEEDLLVGLWPLRWHLLAALVLIALSLATAQWLRPGNASAWPLLESVTTWFSLLATWLAARAKLENWLYWIVINAVSVFLFFAQKVWGMALLSVLLAVIAAGGFIDWRRRLQTQEAVP
jgi:nicotinamide mononucleotide transporter